MVLWGTRFVCLFVCLTIPLTTSLTRCLRVRLCIWWSIYEIAHANTHRQRQMVALLIWDSKTDTYFHPPLLLPFSAESRPTVLCVHTSKPPPYSSKTRRLDRTGTAVLKPHHLYSSHTSEKNKHLGYKTNKQTCQQTNKTTCFINKAWLNHFLVCSIDTEPCCTWSLWYEHYTDGNRQFLCCTYILFTFLYNICLSPLLAIVSMHPNLNPNDWKTSGYGWGNFRQVCQQTCL